MAKIFYYEVDDFLRKEDRYKLLENSKNVYGVDWQEINPNKNHIWLTEGMEDDWESMISIGNKESKQLSGAGGRDSVVGGQGSENIKAIFGLYSRGVVTCRDSWAFNFLEIDLNKNINQSINYYNDLLYKINIGRDLKEDEIFNDKEISWSEGLKSNFDRKNQISFNSNNLRKSFYRPYIRTNVYFDKFMVERRYQFHHIFPTPDCEKENFVICVSGLGSSKPFHALIANLIPELSIVSTSQCFPFYTYDEDGTNRRENISDWSLSVFRERYSVNVGKRSNGFEIDNININEVINAENNNLQRFRGLAESDGSGSNDLSLNREISKEGDVWSGKSDSKSSSISSIEYSGGAGEKHNKGIRSIPENSERFISRTGNAINNNCTIELSNERRDDSNLGIDSDNRKTPQRSNPIPENQTYQQPSTDLRPPITKWDIFYYIYAVLHKPEYREKYAANLKRELPRIPYYDDFWKYSNAGKKLADLHVNYETQEEYYLEKIESPGKQLDYKVEKMKYNKDKTAIIYNDFLTLSGIPIEAHNYKLGNRSALDWIVDQYQVKTDKRSGISNDPNRLDEPDYIITLIGKIVTVSVETVKIVEGLK